MLAKISGGKGVVHRVVSGDVGVSTLISLVGITVVVVDGVHAGGGNGVDKGVGDVPGVAVCVPEIEN